MVPATASLVLFGAIVPGQRAIVGTRTPPSQVVPLPARSGFALPPSAPLISYGPLSLVNTTRVFSDNFRFVAAPARLFGSQIRIEPDRQESQRPIRDSVSF